MKFWSPEAAALDAHHRPTKWRGRAGAFNAAEEALKLKLQDMFGLSPLGLPSPLDGVSQVIGAVHVNKRISSGRRLFAGRLVSLRLFSGRRRPRGGDDPPEVTGMCVQGGVPISLSRISEWPKSEEIPFF